MAWQFFVFFSRFEYALKRTERFLVPGNGKAEANWDRFASDMNDRFRPQDDPLLADAVSYYLENPPRKQLRNAGTMYWSEPIRHTKGPLLVWLILALRTVRNNLFHGGKFPLIVVSDPSRNRELVAHALTILNACFGLDPEVNGNFVEAIFE